MSGAPDRPRILVTGALGQVGWELQRTLAPLGDVTGVDRDELDLLDFPALRDLVRTLRPRAIVNAAAYTAVDRAETEREVAFGVNAEAPRVLAEEAARLGVPLVHYSTDYVFPGDGERPYTEEDAPGPLSVYGESKLAGERALQEVGGAYVVLRTSWVYGARGHNFLRTMLRLGQEREELRVVADQRGAPTWSRMLAEATAQLLAQGSTGAAFDLAADRSGVYHLTAAGETTWYEFTRAIFEMSPNDPLRRCREIHPISTDEYPTPARRPRYSVLDSGRFARAFGIRLPDWRTQLRLVMADLQGG